MNEETEKSPGPTRAVEPLKRKRQETAPEKRPLMGKLHQNTRES
jgi:hypothetical protein